MEQLESNSDRQLLHRYVHLEDSFAFGEIVRRHRIRVLGVCRRVVTDFHTAEDVSQATFFALSQRAQTIRNEETLAAWLSRVAFNKALNIRGQLIKRKVREKVAASSSVPTGPEDWDDTWNVMRSELDQLPEKYRLPIMMCYLEGETLERAAKRLGHPTGSMSALLARGLTLLSRRLKRRGVVLSGAALAAILTPATGSAALPGVVAAMGGGVAGLGTTKAFTVIVASLALAAGTAILAVRRSPEEVPRPDVGAQEPLESRQVASQPVRPTAAVEEVYRERAAASPRQRIEVLRREDAATKKTVRGPGGVDEVLSPREKPESAAVPLPREEAFTKKTVRGPGVDEVPSPREKPERAQVTKRGLPEPDHEKVHQSSRTLRIKGTVSVIPSNELPELPLSSEHEIREAISGALRRGSEVLPQLAGRGASRANREGGANPVPELRGDVPLTLDALISTGSVADGLSDTVLTTQEAVRSGVDSATQTVQEALRRTPR